MILCNVDIIFKNEFKVKKYKCNYEIVCEKLWEVEEKDYVCNFQLFVFGELIMKIFNFGFLYEIGIIKVCIKEVIFEGEILNDVEVVIRFMLQIGEEIGLIVVNN